MERLFLTVLRMSMTASYLILAVMIARFLLKKVPRSMTCMLWIVVGLRLLCPFRIETVFSLLPEQTGSFESQMHHNVSAMQENTMPKAYLLPDAGLEPVSTIEDEAENTDFASKIVTVATWIWMAGSITMIAYLAFNWHRVRKHVSEAVPAEAEKIQFYQCDYISTPFLFGLVVPRIYVPFSVSGKELFYILKHEQAHKKRYDHLTKIAAYLLLSVYWFQPLVWVAYLLFCRDIEMACDESVVKEVGEDCKKAYSQALLLYSLKHRAASVCPVAFGEIGVKKRVKNILNYKNPRRRAVFAAAVVCVAVTACFATEAESKHVPQAETKAGTEHTQEAYASDEENVQGSVQKDLDAITKYVVKWAKAYCGRDAKTIYRMLDDTGRKQLTDANMLDGELSFGWSSPWPWDMEMASGQPNYRILSVNKSSAEILYYAWTSDPHVTVWHQTLIYQYADGTDEFLIRDAALEILDSIHTADQFFTAYPNGEIDGTGMDYFHGNGAGEALNMNALRDNTRLLLQPDTAAIFLLNIQDDPSSVKTDILEQNGKTVVTFTFLEDGGTASVKMIQPAGEHGIWVPQTDL